MIGCPSISNLLMAKLIKIPRRSIAAFACAFPEVPMRVGLVSSRCRVSTMSFVMLAIGMSSQSPRHLFITAVKLLIEFGRSVRQAKYASRTSAKVMNARFFFAFSSLGSRPNDIVASNRRASSLAVSGSNRPCGPIVIRLFTPLTRHSTM